MGFGLLGSWWLTVVYFGGVRFVSVLLSVVLGWVWDCLVLELALTVGVY